MQTGWLLNVCLGYSVCDGREWRCVQWSAVLRSAVLCYAIGVSVAAGPAGPQRVCFERRDELVVYIRAAKDPIDKRNEFEMRINSN
jgi:hypothetical protein